MKYLILFPLMGAICFSANYTSAQPVDLAGKKFVIEGVWKGWNALLRDSVVLVNRVIPRNHDYLEFFSDSTFHFNYFNRSENMGEVQYQKTLWSPGVWDFNLNNNILQLKFDDDQIKRRYKIKAKPNNTIILFNQKPEKE